MARARPGGESGPGGREHSLGARAQPGGESTAQRRRARLGGLNHGCGAGAWSWAESSSWERERGPSGGTMVLGTGIVVRVGFWHGSVWARGAGTMVREPTPGGGDRSVAGRPSHQGKVEDERAGAECGVRRGTPV